MIAAWKGNRGALRSPPNTLVYKRGGAPAEDVKCLYRFVTDKRLFARVILSINAINFKARVNYYQDDMFNLIKPNLTLITVRLIEILIYRNIHMHQFHAKTVMKIEQINW